MESAPFFAEIARGPDGGAAWWLSTADGVRIRAAAWPAAAGVPAQGTLLLFPGRTEYVEKYGVTAADYAARGYAVVTVDWRGQGLATRDTPDQRLGHVGDFDEFQTDIAAVMALAKHLDLPQPFYLLAHSMGGCIGLRALHNGLPVRAAAFSAPMWGVEIAAWLRPIAWTMALAGPPLGLGHRRTPGTEIETYVVTEPFAGNKLTTNPELYAHLRDQMLAQPGLRLGGPTLAWLRAALLETGRLARLPAPALPAVTFLGTHERIVQTGPVHATMAKWRGGVLEMVEGAEHEILMEQPATRAHVVEMTTALFAARR